VTKGGIEPPHKLHELILYRCTSVRTSIPSLAHYCTGCDPMQILCHLYSINYPFPKCMFSFCAGVVVCVRPVPLLYVTQRY